MSDLRMGESSLDLRVGVRVPIPQLNRKETPSETLGVSFVIVRGASTGPGNFVIPYLCSHGR